MTPKSLNRAIKWHEPIPGLRIGMLPYVPFYWRTLREKLVQQVQASGEEWDNGASTFALAQPLIEAVEVTSEELPAWALILVDCLRDKSDDIIQDWQVFRKYASVEAVTLLWDCYQATRDNLPKAPDIIQRGMPEPSDEDESENPTEAGGSNLAATS